MKLDEVDSFFELIQPVCEHNFQVVRFPDEEDEGEDEEMIKQIKKCNGDWFICQYNNAKCKYCETYRCYMIQHLEALDDLFVRL